MEFYKFLCFPRLYKILDNYVINNTDRTLLFSLVFVNNGNIKNYNNNESKNYNITLEGGK